MNTIPFTPVPVRARRDGWTLLRQVMFVFALQELRNVAAACRAVGMSWQTAYRLRARPDAKSFAAAWDAALAGPDLSRPVGGRAIDGVVTPIRYRGRQVGERRRYNNRLAHVSARDPQAGPLRARPGTPPPGDYPLRRARHARRRRMAVPAPRFPR